MQLHISLCLTPHTSFHTLVRSIRQFMDDVVSLVMREHADTLCYKDADQKHVPPKAFFAGGTNPAGIPIFFIAHAPSAAPALVARSHLTSVVLSALQQSNVKADDAEAAVPFAPLNLVNRCY